MTTFAAPGWIDIASNCSGCPGTGHDEALENIFVGIIETARLAPESRELGMFEGMWRKLLERDS